MSIRIRAASKPDSGTCPWRVDGRTISHISSRQGITYPLDQVFRQHSTTQQVYDQVARSLIADVVSGFNSTVFAYVGSRGYGEGRKYWGKIKRRERAAVRGHIYDQAELLAGQGGGMRKSRVVA